MAGCGDSSVRHRDHDHEGTRSKRWSGWYVTEPESQWVPEDGYASALFFLDRMDWMVMDQRYPELRWMASGIFTPDPDGMSGKWQCASITVFALKGSRGQVLMQKLRKRDQVYKGEQSKVESLLRNSAVLTSLPKELVECEQILTVRRKVVPGGRLEIVVEGESKSPHRLLFHGADAFTQALDAEEVHGADLEPWRHEGLLKNPQGIFNYPSNTLLPVAQTKRMAVTPRWEWNPEARTLTGVVREEPLRLSDFRKVPNQFFRTVVLEARWHHLRPAEVETALQTLVPVERGNTFQAIIPKEDGNTVTVAFTSPLGAVTQTLSLEGEVVQVIRTKFVASTQP